MISERSSVYSAVAGATPGASVALRRQPFSLVGRSGAKLFEVNEPASFPALSLRWITRCRGNRQRVGNKTLDHRSKIVRCGNLSAAPTNGRITCVDSKIRSGQTGYPNGLRHSEALYACRSFANRGIINAKVERATMRGLLDGKVERNLGPEHEPNLEHAENQDQ
jgi:hypothetical protein